MYGSYGYGNTKFTNIMKTGLGSSQDLMEYRRLKKIEEMQSYYGKTYKSQPLTFFGNISEDPIEKQQQQYLFTQTFLPIYSENNIVIDNNHIKIIV